MDLLTVNAISSYSCVRGFEILFSSKSNSVGTITMFDNIKKQILFNLLSQLESCQSLNRHDVKEIHNLFTVPELITMARQLDKFNPELDEYRGNTLIGQVTELGMVTGVTIDPASYKVANVTVTTKEGKTLSKISLEEYKEKVKSISFTEYFKK